MQYIKNAKILNKELCNNENIGGGTTSIKNDANNDKKRINLEESEKE